jgi:MFS family permease
MSTSAKITLLFVVFVDLIGQGLVFPIINSLIMEPTGDFLPRSAPDAIRHIDYGLVIGSFFLAWFLGVVYIAKLSDSIGRKNTLLVCLGGALAGYVLTIVAFYVNSLWLLILGRVITGFTAGNQPVAQAAMVDASVDDADRDRNMGYLMIGVSAGLVAGPIIGGVLTDKTLLGGAASLDMPFYGALVLVAVCFGMVLVFFKDIRKEGEPFTFRPAEVAFLVIGIAVALSGRYLVGPAQQRFDKQWIVGASLAVMVISAIAYIASPVAALCYVPVFVFYLLFGVSYPTLLGLFSSSVSKDDQGWVMGVTVAVFTLAGGIMSLIGGGLMDIDIRLPFYVVIGAALLGLAFVALTWDRPDIRQLTHKPVAAPR